MDMGVRYAAGFCQSFGRDQLDRRDYKDIRGLPSVFGISFIPLILSNF